MQFEPALLNDFYSLGIDDPIWQNDYGISSRLKKIGLKAFSKKIKERSYQDTFLPALRDGFKESKEVIGKLAQIGSQSI